MEPEGGPGAAAAWSGVRRIADDLVAESQRGLRQRRAAATLAVVTVWWLAAGAGAAVALIAGTAAVLAAAGLWRFRARPLALPAPSLRRGNMPVRSPERWTASLAAAGYLASLLLGASAGRLAEAAPALSILACAVVLHSALTTVELFSGRPDSPSPALPFAAAVPPLVMVLVGRDAFGWAWALVLPSVAVLVAFVDGRDVVSWQRQLRRRVWVVRAEVQAVDASHIHQAKNVARLVYDDVDRPDARFRAGVRHLVLMLSGLEDTVRSGRDAQLRSATEIVETLRDLDSTVSRSVTVLADVEPGDLDVSDVELMTFLLGDLISNAVSAQSRLTTVEASAAVDERGSRLTIAVTCTCGTPVGPIVEGSSLLQLAGMLANAGGELLLEEGDQPSHSFVASWPCARRVRARAVSSEAGSPVSAEAEHG